ncbi:MAG: hypothetical protein GY926_21090 [bacterium]|nr:hypothetical protein [bacterium]
MSHSPDALACLGWVFDPDLRAEQYVQQLLDAYRQTPTTAGRVRPADRRLALQLFDRSVPLSMIKAAFSLAASRRILRDPEAAPLHPIRSLHYFLPVLDEIRYEPIGPDYIRYIEWKLYGNP